MCLQFFLRIYITSKDVRRSEHLAQVTLRSFACSIRSYTSWRYLCLLGIDIHYGLQVQDRFAQMGRDCRNSQGFFPMWFLLLTLTLYVLSQHLEVIHRSSLFGPCCPREMVSIAARPCPVWEKNSTCWWFETTRANACLMIGLG